MTDWNALNIRHIHIFGAPGAGVSTLGRALAQRLNCPHFDTDDYVWFTGDALPYRRKRNPDHRRQLLTRDLDEAHEGWVLSGSLCGWGDVFIPRFDLVVYCRRPPGLRLERIRQRETQRYGAGPLAPGGELHEVFEKFLSWAKAYDLPSDNWRCREKELAWLDHLPCPTIRLEQDHPVEKQLDELFRLAGK